MHSHAWHLSVENWVKYQTKTNTLRAMTKQELWELGGIISVQPRFSILVYKQMVFDSPKHDIPKYVKPILDFLIKFEKRNYGALSKVRLQQKCAWVWFIFNYHTSSGAHMAIILFIGICNSNTYLESHIIEKL